MSHSQTSPIPMVIADDEPALRRLMRVALEPDQYEVVEASDGDSAWALIQWRRPPLVVLDIVMPGLTGLEICRLIRADPNLSRTRVVILTASSQQYEIAAGLAAGADDYVTKPFSCLQLRDTIARLSGAPRPSNLQAA